MNMITKCKTLSAVLVGTVLAIGGCAGENSTYLPQQGTANWEYAIRMYAYAVNYPYSVWAWTCFNIGWFN